MRDAKGFTLLHWAATYNSSPEVIRVLVRAGADPGFKSNDGKLPADLAAENEHII